MTGLPSQLPSLFRKLPLLLLLEQHRATRGKTRARCLGAHGMRGSQPSPSLLEASGGGRTALAPPGEAS